MGRKPWTKIRQKLHDKADVIIGKGGISPGIVEEAKKLLKAKKIIKVKCLKNIAATKSEAKILIEELANKTGAKVGTIVGKTAILYIEEE